MTLSRRGRGLISALIVGALVVACAATADESELFNGADAGAPSDASRDVTVARTEASTPPPPPPPPIVEDTGTPETDVPAPVCPTSCTQDSECQTMCPSAPTGGQNCCDVGSSACYVSSSGDCSLGGGGDDGGADGGTD